MSAESWEKRLADLVNGTDERAKVAIAAGSNILETRRKLTLKFLDDLSLELRNSVDRFNASAKSAITFIPISKDKRGNDYCGLKFMSRQLLFTDTGRGFVRVDLNESGSIQEAAFLLARLSRTGDFITWEEKSLLGFGNRLEPVTVHHLVCKYITFLVTR